MRLLVCGRGDDGRSRNDGRKQLACQGWSGRLRRATQVVVGINSEFGPVSVTVGGHTRVRVEGARARCVVTRVQTSGPLPKKIMMMRNHKTTEMAPVKQMPSG